MWRQYSKGNYSNIYKKISKGNYSNYFKNLRHAVSVLNNIKYWSVKPRPMSAILPNINSHQTNIEIYEAVTCWHFRLRDENGFFLYFKSSWLNKSYLLILVNSDSWLVYHPYSSMNCWASLIYKEYSNLDLQRIL